MGFNHSVKVPTQYKVTRKVLKAALESKKSIKTLIYEEKHANVRGMQAVLKQYIDNRKAIDDAIDQTQILPDNPGLCPYLCKILVTELLLGRKELKSESKPVLTVRSYEQRLQEALGSKVTRKQDDQKKAFKPRYVRVNTNKISMAEALEMLAYEEWRQKEVSRFDYAEFLTAVRNIDDDEFIVDLHVDNLLIFHPKHKRYWACHQYVQEKKMLLQDKGTGLVLELLRPPAGSNLLDMCAAPGMKTIQSSNALQNSGTIFAVEQNMERYQVLCDMINSAGCYNVQPIRADALTIKAEDCPNVEYILVDPSCSGSGMQNRMSLEPEEKNQERLHKLQGLQIKILSHAMRAFPNVKRIAYSTCSIYEEENEQVVQRCLELHPEFKLLSGKKALHNKWNNTGNTDYKKIGKKCLYSLPEKDFTDGIFVAIFEKLRGDD